ncbi:pentatricopeptide repeat-containing protein At5g15340, mitochondrial [Nicotiana sylvestris]|uniref:Pentatricopeptide repeat-containing protein At5g15340, mitochondrial n=1 Tax=Nicotiana sylvestris TaxID=4096 RepID=A0A1U7X4Q4_NICSY|nr:PREDICTED: pentatricopeptide repeat-containing protein At5g15340, mitochondrial [Nicotiana sylvestris]
MIWRTECTLSLLARHYRTLFRTCARYLALDVGQKLHASVVTAGLESSPNTFIRNAILHMYAACGCALSARKVFDKIPLSYKDTVDWTTLMGCYAHGRLPLDALSLFVDMRKSNVSIDEFTMVIVFLACAKLGCDQFGVQGHGCLVKMGFSSSIKACNAAMDMYVKCGLIDKTRRIFNEMGEKSLVSWTVLLGGLVKWEGFENARLLFDQMPERNEVAWTIMIAAYIENGLTKEAFGLLRNMVFESGFELNFVTLCSWLSACAQSGNVMLGKWVHMYALKMIKHEIDIMVATALINMYAKCGRIDDAFRVFKVMPRRNVVTWNTMLSGLAMQGKGDMVLHLFAQMVREVKPDDVTFTAVLSACSHSGLVVQGRHLFYSLESSYGIKPSVENYSCIVDLLGRAGHLEEAESIIRGMPIAPNEVVLGSLLGSCSVHKNLELGKCLMKELVQMYPDNTEYHVLLSNMYSLAGKNDEADSIRVVLRNRGIRKVPGMSSIYVGGQIHCFSAGDTLHLQSQEIYMMLDEMIRKIRLAGYVPDTACQKFSGSDNGEYYSNSHEEKEQALFTHSEKLAVCFGLISIPAGMPLYIFKNLRICRDCHSAMKIVSKVYNRQIVIRDRSRFHCFKLGSCSCSDYW